jgi:crossover junction endodeoxyribonuclease RuvC
MKRILLGIDPGFADMGWGVIAVEGGTPTCLAYGSVKTAKGERAEKRLKQVYDELSKIITIHKPQSAAIEKLFFSKNVKTAMSVAEARGVIRLCLEDLGIPTREFSPAEVKTAVCGHAAAEKKEMQKMVRTLLRLNETPKPDDAADALAMALTQAFTRTPVTGGTAQ